jgi:sensor histidine kinase YesM
MLAEGDKINLTKYFVYEFTGAYSFFILMPFMILLINKLPVVKGKIFSRIPVYILVIACLGAVYTAIMNYSRILIFDLAGWGTYNYGYIPYRLIMETLKLLTGFLLVYFVYGYFVSNKERQEEKIKALKLEEQLTRTRLDVLKNQIHPHFLFNTLNMISSEMYDNINEADRMIANLSDLLRRTLKNSGSGLHPLKDELEILNFYLEIMKARFKDKLAVKFNIDNSCNDFLVPSFLLQPIVENSIKYGMENLSFVEIEVSAQIISGRLKITVKDNGPGIKLEAEKVFKNGVGLSNTHERLEKIYGNNFEFYWQNLETKGLIVTVIIPGQVEK